MVTTKRGVTFTSQTGSVVNDPQTQVPAAGKVRRRHTMKEQHDSSVFVLSTPSEPTWNAPPADAPDMTFVPHHPALRVEDGAVMRDVIGGTVWRQIPTKDLYLREMVIAQFLRRHDSAVTQRLVLPKRCEARFLPRQQIGLGFDNSQDVLTLPDARPTAQDEMFASLEGSPRRHHDQLRRHSSGFDMISNLDRTESRGLLPLPSLTLRTPDLSAIQTEGSVGDEHSRGGGGGLGQDTTVGFPSDFSTIAAPQKQKRLGPLALAFSAPRPLPAPRPTVAAPVCLRRDFVVTDRYSGTLAQLGTRDETLVPPRTAEQAVVLSMVGVLSAVAAQLAALHSVGVTHNMIHPATCGIHTADPATVTTIDAIRPSSAFSSTESATPTKRLGNVESRGGKRAPSPGAKPPRPQATPKRASVESMASRVGAPTAHSGGSVDGESPRSDSSRPRSISPTTSAVSSHMSLVQRSSRGFNAAAANASVAAAAAAQADIAVAGTKPWLTTRTAKDVSGVLIDMSYATVWDDKRLPMLGPFTLTGMREKASHSEMRMLCLRTPPPNSLPDFSDFDDAESTANLDHDDVKEADHELDGAPKGRSSIVGSNISPLSPDQLTGVQGALSEMTSPIVDAGGPSTSAGAMAPSTGQGADRREWRPHERPPRYAIPPLPAAALDVGTPPEWQTTVEAKPPLSPRPIQVLRTKVAPTPASDVFLFGGTVKLVLGRVSLDRTLGQAELDHLVEQSTLREPNRRLSAHECACHPAFWAAGTTAFFFRAVHRFALAASASAARHGRRQSSVTGNAHATPVRQEDRRSVFDLAAKAGAEQGNAGLGSGLGAIPEGHKLGDRSLSATQDLSKRSLVALERPSSAMSRSGGRNASTGSKSPQRTPSASRKRSVAMTSPIVGIRNTSQRSAGGGGANGTVSVGLRAFSAAVAKAGRQGSSGSRGTEELGGSLTGDGVAFGAVSPINVSSELIRVLVLPLYHAQNQAAQQAQAQAQLVSNQQLRKESSFTLPPQPAIIVSGTGHARPNSSSGRPPSAERRSSVQLTGAQMMHRRSLSLAGSEMGSLSVTPHAQTPTNAGLDRPPTSPKRRANSPPGERSAFNTLASRDFLPWMEEADDWIESVRAASLPRGASAGIPGHYEETPLDMLRFFSEAYSLVSGAAVTDNQSRATAAARQISNGDAEQFVRDFCHVRFPAIISRWLRRLCRNPNDGEAFQNWLLEAAGGLRDLNETQPFVGTASAVVGTMISRFVVERHDAIANSPKKAKSMFVRHTRLMNE